MFLTELAPAFEKLIQQPVAFASGFVSGVLHLNLNEEPLSQWLEKEGHNTTSTTVRTSSNGDRPQSINID